MLRLLHVYSCCVYLSDTYSRHISQWFAMILLHKDSNSLLAQSILFCVSAEHKLEQPSPPFLYFHFSLTSLCSFQHTPSSHFSCSFLFCFSLHFHTFQSFYVLSIVSSLLFFSFHFIPSFSAPDFFPFFSFLFLFSADKSLAWDVCWVDVYDLAEIIMHRNIANYMKN